MLFLSVRLADLVGADMHVIDCADEALLAQRRWCFGSETGSDVLNAIQDKFDVAVRF